MVYVAVYHRQSPDDPWPLDHGDDPSFGSSQRRRGPLTWGVCRPDVRRAARPGDLLIFFAADRLRQVRPDAARYQFVGFATVNKCVRQTDFWTVKSLKAFRWYDNLLVRSDGGRLVHFEPALPGELWHGDWLRRLASNPKAFSRAEFEDAERTKHLPHRINGRRYEVGANYIVFGREPSETFILTDPPVIATVKENGLTETWEKTRFAVALRRIVLGQTTRSLRTTHPQRAHRHIRLDVDGEQLRLDIRRLCNAHGLRPRNGRTRLLMAARPDETGSKSC
jgi:hypothetical protein